MRQYQIGISILELGTLFMWSVRMKNIDGSSLSRGSLHMILTYRLLNGEEGVDYRKFFSFAENEYDTRGHSKKLEKPTVRLDTRKYFFSCRVVDTWNELTEEEVTAKSTHMFKKLYDENEKRRQEIRASNVYQT